MGAAVMIPVDIQSGEPIFRKGFPGGYEKNSNAAANYRERDALRHN
jgi:hypothetical protein